jgi:hypothetical protein
MTNSIRYGDFASAMGGNQVIVSYNTLTPKPEFDAQGGEVPYRAPPLTLKPLDIYRLLQPYISERLWEQIKSVVPLTFYLVLFQTLILRSDIANAWTMSVGIGAVIIGLMLFMEGLKLGLMPFGETIGAVLPVKSPLSVVLTIVLLLGVGVTFAEPAIGALKTAGRIVDVHKAPYLWSLLNQWSEILVLMVGMGVGLAAVLGTLRFIYGWSLKPLVYAMVIPAIVLTVICMLDSELSKIVGLAWDCGAVTTGPVTVPLVLSLGIGVAASVGKGESSLSGFGIVTLASLFPVIMVLGLAFYVVYTVPVESIIAYAVKAQALDAVQIPWYQRSPAAEIVGGLRAIVPLVIFLFLVLKLLLKENVKGVGIIVYGIVLCVLGMIVFNLGLSYGLALLGGQSGGLIPAAFTGLETVEGSPLYGSVLGIIIALVFALLLGFGATLAEPALNALGLTVETLTNGAFKKSLLMYSVAWGVGVGISIGIAKIIFDVPTAYLLIPGYLIALVLTVFSTEEFVNVAWDSAGVTTGPVTVPLVLAMGLGFGDATQAVEGFGILAMASICPILSVLTMGVLIRANMRRTRRREEQEELEEFVGEPT